MKLNNQRKNCKIREFRLILFIFGFILMSFQIGSAQTVEEVLSKDLAEQIKIVSGIVDDEIKQLISKTFDGRQKSQDELKRDRRIANYLRAFYTSYAINKVKVNSEHVPDNVLKWLRNAELSKKRKGTIPIQKFFVDYVNKWYEEFYNEPAETWKKSFDLLTDLEQVKRFRNEEARRKQELVKRIREGFDREIEKAKKERLEAIEKLDEIYKNNASPAYKRERTNAIIVIYKLELAFRPLTANSKKMILTLTNETERTADFYLKCNTGTSTEKTLLISMPAKGIKQIGFVKDKFSFILGESCGFYYNEEKVEDFKVEK